MLTHNDPVYERMIVGISSKAGDLEINLLKGKKLTNMRTQNTDEKFSNTCKKNGNLLNN